ncbi:MAG: O-antigen ligase family protein [Crocinitomicaceae bacterium]|nr:O-antigen ligase family protein [Crocinitomicaceae bacterium]
MKTTAKNNLSLINFNVLLLSMVIVLLLFAPRFVPVVLTGWAFFSFIHAGLNRITPKFGAVQIFLIILYLFYVVGGIWSENKGAWAFHLEVKMTMLVVPVVFAFTRLSWKHIRWITYIFLIGLMSHFSLLFIKAVITLMQNGTTDVLFYTTLSPDIHPAYYAFYINIAIALVLVDMFNDQLRLFPNKWMPSVLILLMAAANIFLLSKMGILTALFLSLMLLVYWIRRKKYWLVILVVSASLIFGFVVYKKSAYVQWRVVEMVEALSGGHSDNYIYSTSLRIAVWETARDKFMEQPIIGYGPGDVKDVLHAEYVERELRKAPELNLNAHNQFLETGLGLGVIGLILLGLILVYPIVKYRKNHLFGAAIGLVTLLFFLSESVLETQAGVVGGIVFLCLFNLPATTSQRKADHKTEITS